MRERARAMMAPYELPARLGAEVLCAQRAEERPWVVEFGEATGDGEWAEILSLFDAHFLEWPSCGNLKLLARRMPER